MSFSTQLLFATLAILMVSNVDGFGMPMMAPPAPQCCCAPPPPPQPCCPCGGRKKREAVLPHLKTEELSCPQESWKSLIIPQITENDATQSAFAIQTTMYKKFEGKFFVSCVTESEDKPHRLAVHGDGFCIVKANGLVCQVISISA